MPRSHGGIQKAGKVRKSTLSHLGIADMEEFAKNRKIKHHKIPRIAKKARFEHLLREEAKARRERRKTP